tara:strand:+ start:551 stop:907 length:357 start_codon:yes stop_codon:yes gene_type:complete
MGIFTIRELINKSDYKKFFNLFHKKYLKDHPDLNYGDISSLDQKACVFFEKVKSEKSNLSVIDPSISVNKVNNVEISVNAIDSSSIKKIENLIDSKVSSNLGCSEEELLCHIFYKFWL